jgi:hypothetical protein
MESGTQPVGGIVLFQHPQCKAHQTFLVRRNVLDLGRTNEGERGVRDAVSVTELLPEFRRGDERRAPLDEVCRPHTTDAERE